MSIEHSWNPFATADGHAPPPWLPASWQPLVQRISDNRVPHALLIEGADGTGRHLLADRLVALLLCESPSKDSTPCRRCQGCGLLQAATHPDLYRLLPESEDSQIRIDEVRGLNEWLQLTPQYGRWKIGLLSPAERMNRASANSLLKTLEEPPSSVLLILISRVSGLLPATIRSRCQRTAVQVDDPMAAQHWLVEAGVSESSARLYAGLGTPMLAFSESTVTAEQRQQVLQSLHRIVDGKASIARLVEELAADKKMTLPGLLETMTGQVASIIRIRMAPGRALSVADEPHLAALQHLAGALETADWFSIHDQLTRLSRLDGKSFRLQTVLEGIFADIRLSCLERQRGAV